MTDEELETLAGQRMRDGSIEQELVDAWKELQRMGHRGFGCHEIIFVFGDDGKPLCTSHVGDPGWDSTKNRKRTFDYIARKEEEERELRQILADHDAAPDGVKPWAATVSKVRALLESPDEWHARGLEKSKALQDDPDAWYAAEVERMKERAPA